MIVDVYLLVHSFDHASIHFYHQKHMFRVISERNEQLCEAQPRKTGTLAPQLPSNKYYVSLHFGFLHEL